MQNIEVRDLPEFRPAAKTGLPDKATLRVGDYPLLWFPWRAFQGSDAHLQPPGSCKADVRVVPEILAGLGQPQPAVGRLDRDGKVAAVGWIRLRSAG